MTTRLPSVFVSHGSPMLALEPGTAGPMLQALGAALPRPAAVLALSPHWMTRVAAVGASPQPGTIHDFAGFDPALHALQYPAPGDPALAERVAALLRAGGWDAVVDPARGLDHGIWSPLRFVFPQADIPVVPLAMPWPLDAASAWRLGQALAPLAADGVLALGSGSLTHNLDEFGFDAKLHDPPAPYVVAFVDWMRDAIARGDIDALLDYRRRAPHAQRAHPTDEHLLALFWALGAAGPTPIGHDWPGGVHYGTMSMDAWVFDAASSPPAARSSPHH